MSGNLIGRREFLVVSSTVSVATAALGPRLFASEGTAPRRLTFGYAPLDADAPVRSALEIPASDGGFIGRGARIVVSGSSGGSGDPRARRALEFLAHFSYYDGAERKIAPFRAWATNRTPGEHGHSVAFHVPVDEVQKISFSVGVERPSDGMVFRAVKRRASAGGDQQTLDALPVVLSLQGEADSLKLARGFYVIVPLFDGDSEPRWPSWTLATREGRVQLVDAAGNPASFEHFVLKTDYATT